MKIKSLFVLFIFVLIFSSCTQDNSQLNEIENVAGLNDQQVGFKLNLTGGIYSMGENGITYNSGVKTKFEVTVPSYTDVTLDMYGVVKRNGKDYRGSRIISNNLD